MRIAESTSPINALPSQGPRTGKGTTRVVGLCCDNPGAAEHFLAMSRGIAEESPGEHHEIIEGGTGPHRVLGVISRAVHPPVASYAHPDGSVCILDGHAFNAADLWPCCAPSGDGLAQTLLASYLSEGTSRLGSLDAAGHLFVFDAREGQAFLARDAIGNAPVFFAARGSSLYWSSDLLALLPFSERAEIDPDGVDHFLSTGYVPAPLSFVKGIARLPPGTVLSWKSGVLKQERYWRPSALRQRSTGCEKTLARLFPRAVARRIEDVSKTGILLSGGVDSKLVLAVTARDFGAPRSFTFRYGGYDGPLNEGAKAREAARYFGAEHEEIPVDPRTIPDRLPRLLRAFGEPFCYGLHTVMLDTLATSGIRTLLSGAGADDYYVGGQERHAMLYLSLPRPVRAALSALVKAYRGAEAPLRAGGSEGVPIAGDLARRLADGIWCAENGLPYYLGDHMAPFEVRRKLYQDETLAFSGRRAQERIHAVAAREYAEEMLPSRFKLLQMQFFGAEMVQNWNHASGLLHGLSIRAPFLDRELRAAMVCYELAHQGKPELRRYAAGMMPRDIAFAPKLHHSVPISEWVHGPLRDFIADTLAPPRLNRHGLFNPRTVARLLGRGPGGPVRVSWLIWNLALVTLWQDSLRPATSTRSPAPRGICKETESTSKVVPPNIGGGSGQ